MIFNVVKNIRKITRIDYGLCNLKIGKILLNSVLNLEVCNANNFIFSTAGL